MLTPYQYASNNSIQNIDLDGLEGEASNGANTNTSVAPWDLGFLKQKKQSYANTSWFTASKQFTFGKNVVTSAWNQGVESVEAIPTNINYIVGKKPSKQERFDNLINTIGSFTKWWNSKPFQKVSTYEDIGGALLLGESMGVANPFARGNSYIKLIAKDKVPVILANAEELRFLEVRSAQADYNPYANNILLSKNSRILLIEEAIHYRQTKTYGIKYVEQNLNILEFDAQLELLRIGKLEGWSKSSMNEIRKAALVWGKKAVADLQERVKASKKKKT